MSIRAITKEEHLDLQNALRLLREERQAREAAEARMALLEESIRGLRGDLMSLRDGIRTQIEAYEPFSVSPPAWLVAMLKHAERH